MRTPTTSATGATPRAGELLPVPVDVRTRIAAAWTAMLFVFAYVDLFSLYRPDVRAELATGELAGFTVGEAFLLGATVYVLLPSVMLLATLVLRAHVARWLNVGLGAVYAATIVVAAIGEMGYYVLGSVVEVALLATVVRWAWAWPRA